MLHQRSENEKLDEPYDVDADRTCLLIKCTPMSIPYIPFYNTLV